MVAFCFEVRTRYPDGLMVRVAAPRELFSQGDLILGRPLIFFEAECDCSQVAPLLRRQRRDRGRIQTRRKENAHRDIGNEMVAHSLRECLAEKLGTVGQALPLARINCFGSLLV